MPLSGFSSTITNPIPDTEDLYTIATNEVLKQHGRPSLPWSIKAQLQGRPRAEANHIFFQWSQLPITREEYFEQQSELHRQHFPTCAPLPGAAALLTTLQVAGVALALATSSHQGNFYLKTDHLKDFMSPFPPERRVLGDDPRIPKGRGKPAPDIYLVALETINAGLRKEGKREIRVEECLVLEDSVPGVEAGRRAGMRVLWVPHPELKAEFQGKEAQVLAGKIGDGEGLEPVEGVPAKVLPAGALAGWPSKEGDGWAEAVDSLEEFDYPKYGIKVPAKAKV